MSARQLSIVVSPGHEAAVSQRRGYGLRRLLVWAVREWRRSAVIAARVDAHREEQVRRYRASHIHPWQ